MSDFIDGSLYEFRRKLMRLSASELYELEACVIAMGRHPVTANQVRHGRFWRDVAAERLGAIRFESDRRYRELVEQLRG